MDISYFGIFCSLLILLLVTLRHIKIGNYEPDKVLKDLGDNICVNYSVIGSKTIAKDSIVKIQIAGNCVSLFNKSDHALDIHIPREAWARNIFKRAKVMLPHAEILEIDG